MMRIRQIWEGYEKKSENETMDPSLLLLLSISLFMLRFSGQEAIQSDKKQVSEKRNKNRLQCPCPSYTWKWTMDDHRTSSWA